MIFRSPFPEVSIPEVPFSEFVLQRVAQFGEKPAFVDSTTGRAITYAHFPKLVRRLAAGLAARGMKKNDVMAILLPNVVEYPLVVHPVETLGAIFTTLNPLNTADEIAKQLHDSGAKFAVTLPQLNEKLPGEICRFVIGTTSFEQLLETDLPVPEVTVDPRKDLLALPYSSGTTGLPKGVMLTHYNLVANLLQIDASVQVQQEDWQICFLPFFHIYGLVVIMNLALYKGATTVILQRYDFELFLKTIQDYKITFAPVVPPVVLEIAKNPAVDRYDLSSLKTIFCAAAPLKENIIAICRKRLESTIKQGYGMTEASPATHMCFHDPPKIKPGSVGPCVSNTECKVVDLTGKELGPNEEGEICIRGPQIMLGYLNRPDATAESIDSEGWLHTGDIGYADEDGHFYIVDRLKELIKYKGFQVAPAELETVLLAHPNVADAAVIPIPDPKACEVPKAFIVLKGPADADEIMDFVAQRVAPYKKIRCVEFIEEIPKSPSGKILRRLLMDRERSHVQS